MKDNLIDFQQLKKRISEEAMFIDLCNCDIKDPALKKISARLKKLSKMKQLDGTGDRHKEIE